MVGEHEQRLARIEPHTHGVEDVQRRLTQALELLRLMEVQVRRTAQGDERLAPQADVSSGTVPLHYCEPYPFRGCRTRA